MLSFAKAKRTANLLIDDYVIRMVDNNGRDLDSIRSLAEKPLPGQVIESGRIIDEPQFYHFMKETVQEWGIRNRQVRFFVPQSLVILREIELETELEADEIRPYIEFEIGNTIHFPFTHPIFDIYEANPSSRKVTVLAAPEEELLKYSHTFSDVSLRPQLAEIQPLAIYRYFLHKEGMKADKVYMVIEYNLASINISIFHQQRLEFLRHQPLTLSKEAWQYDESTASFRFTGDPSTYQGEIEDQLAEIDRLRNFYRFSIHHGEKEINEILLLGDSPDLEKIDQAIRQRYDLSTRLLEVEERLNQEPIARSFIPTLGLALRGGK